MSKQIFATFVRSNKAETLCVIEPFYNSSCHYNFLFHSVNLGCSSKAKWQPLHCKTTANFSEFEL
jgi:hypothetical protein